MGEFMRLHENLDFWAGIRPEAEFAVQGHRVLTYGEAAERMDRMASALAQALAPGERFALVAKNSVDVALLYLAASKAGVVPVPLNYRLAPPEWAYILNDSGARLLIAGDEFVSALGTITPDADALVATVAWTEHAQDGPWVAFEEWLSASPATSSLSARCCDDAFQAYTSGTTGRPKGALLTQGALFAQMYQWRVAWPIGTDARVLIIMPMYHIGGLLLALHAVGNGAAMYVLADFDPVEVVRVLDEEGIGLAVLVPSMIQACLNVPGAGQRRYARLPTISYGGSPIAASTLRQAMSVFRCEFTQSFGMTECPAFTLLTSADHRRALAGAPHLLQSTGRHMPGCEVRIVDDDDNEVPPGTIGEVCGRGPQMMRGYWNLPDATADALRGGWMHTGDAGYVDDHGYLYIKDRVKDMIVSGAENVYPREVEDVLLGHTAVADTAVIGVPSEQWGETVKAIVVRRPGTAVTEGELIEFCQSHLANFKRPRSVDFVDEIPRNPSGKILKRLLRESYWKGHDRFVS
jgi:acyl-CoA synthetase (AMP-forming)/AMP-acid ligase II